MSIVSEREGMLFRLRQIEEGAAADLIMQQSARIAELEGALRPFAEKAGEYDVPPNDLPDAHPVQNSFRDETAITIGHLRRARKALSGETP